MEAILFWLSFLLILYVYLFYPLLSSGLSLLIGKTVKKKPASPGVTIIVSAYNEEKHIQATIENKLNMDYPKDKVEIIVVSDGSTDRTEEIVRSFEDVGVRLLKQTPRQGKTSALNMAVFAAKENIIVFSDSNSIYSQDALKRLVAALSDTSVGYVTGKMTYFNQDGSGVGEGCSSYMKYENMLRSIETSIGSVVGVDGGIDAIRKELFTVMRADQLPDFILPLKVVEKGYRVVYEPMALLKEDSLNKSSDEYRMRVRVALRALQAIKDMRHLLNPVKYGLFSWQLFSHKVLRYCIFMLLGTMYVFNMLLVTGSYAYLLIFLLQNMFYVSALTGHYLEKRGINIKFFYIPFYFCLLNLASGHAFLKFLRNEKQVIWTPRKG